MTLRTRSLSFSYSSDHSLISELNLNLHPGAKIALTGPNGSGKTTLLRLLAGIRQADEGQVQGSCETLLLEQHLQGDGKPVSGGELRIQSLREVFFSGAAVILVDEPTNDLDSDAREWLKNEILACRSSLLLVSHDPMILDLVDEIWELKQGKITKHPPGFNAYILRLDQEEARLREEVDSLKAESRRAHAHAREVLEAQEKRMHRGKKAGIKENLPKIIRGSKMRQAQATHARVKKVQEDRSEQVRTRMISAQKRLRDLSMFEWDSSATQPPIGKSLAKMINAMLPGWQRSLSFEMQGPKRIYLKGKNGSGKSTLLRALNADPKARARISGEFHLAVPHCLFDQGLSQFTSSDPLWKWFRSKTQLEVAMARTILGRLGFEQEEQLRPVSALSGGERVRLEIAVALHAKEPPQLLLLDEPTNHLDLESRRILQKFIEAFEGGIVVVSHDSKFIASMEFDEVIDLDAYR